MRAEDEEQGSDTWRAPAFLPDIISSHRADRHTRQAALLPART